MIGQVVHRFVRSPSYVASVNNRIGNRAKPFENTLTVLKDPKNNRELFLVGTTNSSTLLANRTRKLIQKEKPDSVYVQTSKEWADLAKLVKDVHNQPEFNNYHSSFLDALNCFKTGENNPRGLIFKFRLASWLFVINAIKGFPGDFHPFIPGLEMKYAVEEAERLNASLVFGGNELNATTIRALELEKRMDVLPLAIRSTFAIHNKLWLSEEIDTYNSLRVHGGEAFAESMDRFRVNWFVKLFEKYAPRQKQIIVDLKDEEIFYSLYRNNGKKIVAVINQWHVPGVEAHWRHATGTEEALEPINPVGDFDINAHQERQLINDTLREYVSKVGKTEPATWSNHITQYVKETTEYHRIRHVSFDNAYDSHMYHGLPYGSHHHDHHDAHHAEHVLEAKKPEESAPKKEAPKQEAPKPKAAAASSDDKRKKK